MLIKRLLFIIFFMLSACSTSRILSNQKANKEYFESLYNNNNRVILLSNEIDEFNKNVFKNNQTLIDFNNLPKNLKNKKNLKFAVVVSKCNLRARPTNKPEFEDKNDTHFDSLQYKELKIGEGVILHRTVNRWALVSSYNVRGYVESENLAFFDSYNDFKNFINEKNFAVVTSKQININDNNKNITLDMGVKLPLIKEDKNFFVVKLPKRNDKGNVIFEKLKLPSADVHNGYLAYTKRNLIRQSLKYLSFPYGWGGLDNGVDCSGYILNVYSVFGFKFPRNSSQEQNLNGKAMLVSNGENLKSMLNNKMAGSLLYFPGHIMIYLGKKDEKDYIIHAIAYMYDKNMKKYEIFKVVLTDTDIIRKTGNQFKDEIVNVTEIK